MRKKVIAGNWKMNMTPTEAINLTEKLKKDCNVDFADVIFCVPFVDISVVKEKLEGTNIILGAQNFYFEDKGAFTGEISLDMLIDAGISCVIIGHSERRDIFKEDNNMINKKLLKAHEKNILPILCVGESLDCKEKGNTLSFIKEQIVSAFENCPIEFVSKTIIAYEPIWAIGTGKTATSNEANDVCTFIRQVIKEIYSEDIANEVRILYGGSVNSANAKELFTMENIDGGLVGGASLKEDFIKIVNYM